MSATRLNNGSFQASHINQQRLPIVVRLLAQGSVVVLIVAFGWGAVADLGSSTLTAQPEPIYVAGCPVPDTLDKGSAQEDVSKGGGCSKEGSSHPITSRQLGAGLGEQEHGAERHREDKAPPRTSEKSPSTHSGE